MFVRMTDVTSKRDNTTYNCVGFGETFYLYQKAPVKKNGKTYKVARTATHKKVPVKRNKLMQANDNSVSVDISKNSPNLYIKVWSKVENNEYAKSPEHYIGIQRSVDPNVIAAGADDAGNAYLIMPDYGFNLTEALKIKLSPEQRIQIISSLLEQVAILEKKGIFHRNLTPENIHLKYDEISGNYTVKLTGFGNATLRSDTKYRGGNAIFYSAPDEKISHASDRYSLGPIIALILGCNAAHMLDQRNKAKNIYSKLSPKAQHEYKVNQLPGYDFVSLPKDWDDKKPGLRDEFWKLLSDLTNRVPDKRPLLEYTALFFKKVANAMQQESGKGFLVSVGEGVSKLIGVADDAFEGFDSYMTDRPSRYTDRPQPKTLREQTKAELMQSTGYLIRSMGSLRHKFEGTNSTGIMEVFNRFDEANITVDAIVETMQRVGAEKKEPLSCWRSLFCCFFRPRNENIDALYQDFDKLNDCDTREKKVEVLQSIELKMRKRTFVS